MKPIPEQAMPVVEILRKDVPKPDKLPTGHCWVKGGLSYCPMGLHPNSSNQMPIYYDEFAGGICDSPAMGWFMVWWDGLGVEDAQEAVDAVWGEEEEESHG